MTAGYKVFAPHGDTLTWVAQRLLCWSNRDRRIVSSTNDGFHFLVPAQLCADYGPLALLECFTGPVVACAGSQPPTEVITLNISPGEVAGINVNTCTEDPCDNTAPVIDAITPDSGPQAGGTTVTITGSGFQP